MIGIESQNRFLKSVKTPVILAVITLNSILLNSYRYDYNIYLSLISAKKDLLLFQRDIFVQTLLKHEIGWFWKIAYLLSEYLSKERTFFLLHLVTLYFTIYGIYSLSLTLFKKPLVGYISVILFSIGIRQWIVDAPQIYYFFVHHSSFSLPFLIFAINYFIRKKYVPALFLTGIVVNFQLMYAFFVSFIFLLYLFLNIKKVGVKTLCLSLSAFIIPAVPGLIPIFGNFGKMEVGKEWYDVVKWTLWIHIYPSKWGFDMFRNFFIFLIAFIISFKVSPFSEDKKTIKTFFLGILLLCAAGTIFSEYKPIPTIMQLHLWRSTWIYFIIALCFISNFLVSSFNENIWRKFGVIGTGLVITSYVTTKFNSPRCYYETPYWLLPLFLLFIIAYDSRIDLGKFRFMIQALVCSVSGAVLVSTIFSRFRNSFFDIGRERLAIFIACLFFLFIIAVTEKYLKTENKKSLLIIFALIFALIINFAIIYERKGFSVYFRGYDEKNVNPWIDIQLYAKNNTDKNSLFVVPPYTANPDFRMFSERASFGDWIDGGLTIFFGNDYGKKWLERMRDLGLSGETNFDVGLVREREEYNSINEDKLLNVAKKYNANYAVFEKPKELSLPLVYENRKYRLYALKR
ncbi:MAG: hypothetical protein A2043_08395 [Candidatus Schekmanbacteria bacterium GWA2_38_9]|uniref:DUF6798 domain-containing protein n=1 Tax=Candidatus Schekmanbacteria bacterium RIFCSPLOWO2_12_FULL_38_15 TaxID=1817883 RepID=A0A1F7SMC7_9BACT|nr:MAG: hypothetical protein A2043_08395 [Candidatus Schekmanbacteria bacterium GWA2_38_9]OGL48470.1 MAG: hypothetical protein A3H37_07550 [Candidatus Schekmanbacteria bacterium RIFCSPLOWO2_02_FULL_38_14]OGL54929.1 MAG: hypothetical protein A3G31_02290 [Candidatus Schekmanbacteria bacterium RIFCSPLOWO2_12_FULL_38_15]